MTDYNKENPVVKRTIEVSQSGTTRGLQLSINETRANGYGAGYRIAGPKFDGTGKVLLSHEITERDAKEIYAVIKHLLPPGGP